MRDGHNLQKRSTVYESRQTGKMINNEVFLQEFKLTFQPDMVFPARH